MKRGDHLLEPKSLGRLVELNAKLRRIEIAKRRGEPVDSRARFISTSKLSAACSEQSTISSFIQ